MSTKLTLRQEQVLAFMRKFFEMNDQLPTNKAIAQAFGWASDSAADEHQQALEARGLLVRNELGNRMFARGGRA